MHAGPEASGNPGTPNLSGGLTQIEGITVGHASDFNGITGCTVILCPGADGTGAVASCDVRGSAVGEKELEVLRPGHLVERIHALVLAGGSAFGLDAASGVMRFQEEKGVGFDVGVARVPIVPAAILFDLAIGDPKARPTAEMGYQAACNATRAAVEEGSVGAGTGATVGKLFGLKQAMKGGIGSWSEELAGGVRVAALAAVNAFGDVRDPKTGAILAGARTAPESALFADSAMQMRRGVVRRGFATPNTTLVVVATDAQLSKIEAAKMAAMAQDGLARAISPVHTIFDGDIAFALSCGKEQADLNTLGSVAAEAAAQAIVRAVQSAKGLGGVPGLAG